jgi:hypothetical protein
VKPVPDEKRRTRIQTQRRIDELSSSEDVPPNRQIPERPDDSADYEGELATYGGQELFEDDRAWAALRGESWPPGLAPAFPVEDDPEDIEADREDGLID